jgi:hypothetical protein
MDRMQHPADNKSKEMLLFTALAEWEPPRIRCPERSLARSPLFSGNFPRAASHVMKEAAQVGAAFFMVTRIYLARGRSRIPGRA